MRILFVTTRPYLPQKVGGAESCTHDLIGALRERGCESMVISGLLASNDKTHLSNRVKKKIFRQRFPIDHAMGYPAIRTWNIIGALEHAKKVFNPDLAVLIPCDGKAKPFSIELEKLGVPVILHLHDVQFDELGDPREMPVHGAIANSKFTSNAFERRFDMHAPVVYNVFNPDKYKVDKVGNYVTFINPVPLKGLKVAIELAKRNPEVNFLFVEGWPLKENVKKGLLKELQEIENIEWMNRVMDMREVYSRSFLLIVPSICEEAWGRVASEAQFSGIPIIASNIGGLPEAVGPGGLVVDPDCIEEWDRTLKTLLKEPEEWYRLSNKARVYSTRAELAPSVVSSTFLKVVTTMIRKDGDIVN